MKSFDWFYILQDKLEAWWIYSIGMLPNFLLALIVLIFFYLIARVLRKISEGFILRLSRNQSLAGLLSGLIYLITIVAGLMGALDILQLEKAVASLIAGVGIVGLALGFAFQDLTSNFISGAFIAIKRPFDVGHTVETNGFLGTIEDIQLRSTTLRTSAGLHVIIPNKDIFQKPIINYSKTDARRAEFDFLIPNTIDVVFAEKLMLRTLVQMKDKYGVYGLEFYFTAIETPNIRVNLSFWTTAIEPREFMKLRHRTIRRIALVFRDHKIYNISIPFPKEEQNNESDQKG